MSETKTSAIKWLNKLLFLETLLGIYRNYCSQKKKTKCFIIFKIFFQTMCYSMVVSIKLYFLLGGDLLLDQVNVIYAAFSVSAYVNCLLSIVTGVCYSRYFMSYYRSIGRLSDWFKNDTKLMKSVKKIYWSTIIFTLLIVSFVLFRSLDVLNKFSDKNIFLVILVLVAQMIIRVTLLYQQILLFVVIMIVVHLFKSLISLISDVQERIESFDICSDEQCLITREKIQEWVEMYRDLANCCDKVSLSFGREYLFSLVLSMPNNILMIYQICYQAGSRKGLYSDGFKKATVAFVTYGSVMLLPLVAGQFARNQGRKCHRVLARLYNTMIKTDSYEAEMKLIKDFIRLMKKNPIDIKLLSKIPAGMYMLPVILTLSINYVIVLLQINHVI